MGLLDAIFGGGKTGKNVEKTDIFGNRTGKSYERVGDKWLEKERCGLTGKVYRQVGDKLIEEDMSGHRTGKSYRRVGDKLIESNGW